MPLRQFEFYIYYLHKKDKENQKIFLNGNISPHCKFADAKVAQQCCAAGADSVFFAVAGAKPHLWRPGKMSGVDMKKMREIFVLNRVG
jgi:hypothetical protein